MFLSVLNALELFKHICDLRSSFRVVVEHFWDKGGQLWAIILRDLWLNLVKHFLHPLIHRWQIVASDRFLRNIELETGVSRLRHHPCEGHTKHENISVEAVRQRQSLLGRAEHARWEHEVILFDAFFTRFEHFSATKVDKHQWVVFSHHPVIQLQIAMHYVHLFVQVFYTFGHLYAPAQ